MKTTKIYFKLLALIVILLVLNSCEKEDLKTDADKNSFNRYSFSTTHFQNLPDTPANPINRTISNAPNQSGTCN